ncbi:MULTISPECIES: 4-phosphopantetheinyl transferase [unclassified Streptomyces]|uniref:4'-phosphopantetheinyl transferase family protein n=1 Tax=unclassified Streptomyces TaxID=2593676 RepID=UPI000DC3A9D9|nr:4-phosphopantetheinyl transferase [Streptomyces sp. PsTaAH-137]RAJ82397.1 4'-phosphopantetheinyl transferase [Streptomyces sp. PsTaAH-137]
MSARATDPSSPRPAEGPTLVSIARTAEVLDAPSADARTLAGWERRRLALVRVPSRRDDVLAARLLLRWCVARVLGRPPDAVEVRQHCPDCRGTGHGRPFLPGQPGLGISMSHADGLVAAAVGPGPVGVDIERDDRVPPGRDVLLRHFPAAAHHPGADPLRQWVEAEARFKAGDTGQPVRSWYDVPRAACAAVSCAASWQVRGAADLSRRLDSSAQVTSDVTTLRRSGGGVPEEKA